MDEADWAQALADVDHASTDLAMLGRLLGVSANLTAWRVQESRVEGELASDALDQALGLLDEFSDGRAAQLADVVRKLMTELPPGAD